MFGPILKREFVRYLMRAIYSVKLLRVVFTNEVPNYYPPSSLTFCFTMPRLMDLSVLASLAAKLQ